MWMGSCVETARQRQLLAPSAHGWSVGGLPPTFHVYEVCFCIFLAHNVPRNHMTLGDHQFHKSLSVFRRAI